VCDVQESELAELRGTAAADKMEGRVQHPGDAPTRVSYPKGEGTVAA
jgi:hypothetical protein